MPRPTPIQYPGHSLSTWRRRSRMLGEEPTSRIIPEDAALHLMLFGECPTCSEYLEASDEWLKCRKCGDWCWLVTKPETAAAQ